METVYLKEFGVLRILDKAFAVRARTLCASELPQEDITWVSSLAGRVCCEATEAQKELLSRLRLIADTPETADDRHARDRALLQKAQPLLYMHALELMVAQGCNMRCDYCYGDNGAYGKSGMMSRDMAFQAIDLYRGELARNDAEGKTVPEIIFFGGEPLLNEGLIRSCVEYARSIWDNVQFGITTNMTLLTEDMLSFCIKNHVSFVASYDGTPELQRRNRHMCSGGDSYAAVKDKMRMLLAAAPTTPCRATRYLEDDERAIEAGIRAEGFHKYEVHAISGSLCGGVARGDVFVERKARADRLIDLCARLTCAARAEDGQAVHNLIQTDRNGVCAVISLLYSSVPPRDMMYCGAGRTRFALSADGTWYPCHRFVGSVYTLGTLQTGIDTSLRGVHPITDHPKCSTCFLRYGCPHDCLHVLASDAPDEAGVNPLIRAPEVYCALLHARFAARYYLHAVLSDQMRDWLIRETEALLND